MALQEANINYVFVPPGCTDALQPLDADGGVNHTIKRSIKKNWAEYHQLILSEHVYTNGLLPADFELDMRLSTIKPVHAEWVHRAFNDLKPRKDIIKKGWEKTGIAQTLEDLV